MHLRARTDQVVRLDEHAWEIEQGETIHTENSHKWSVDGFAALAASAGLSLERVWTDDDELFSVHLYRIEG